MKLKIEISPRTFPTGKKNPRVSQRNKMGSVTKEELENFAVNLKKVQDKFLNDWTGESFLKARLEDKENHENILAKGKGNCVYNEDCNETAV